MMLLTFLNISQQRDSSWSPKLNLPKVGGRGDHKQWQISIMTHRKPLSLTGLADPILHLFHLTINIFWQRWHSLHKDINIFQQRRHSLHIVICKVEVLPNPGKHHHQENKSQARGNPHLLSGCLYKAPPYSQLCRVNAELARVLFNNLDMIGEIRLTYGWSLSPPFSLFSFSSYWSSRLAWLAWFRTTWTVSSRSSKSHSMLLSEFLSSVVAHSCSSPSLSTPSWSSRSWWQQWFSSIRSEAIKKQPQ